jgi:hypothetical protein
LKKSRKQKKYEMQRKGIGKGKSEGVENLEEEEYEDGMGINIKRIKIIRI